MTGQNKITGLRRRDKFQSHLHNITEYQTLGGGGNPQASATATTPALFSTSSPVTDGTNGTPRTGSKTEMESTTAMLYLYVGSYTA